MPESPKASESRSANGVCEPCGSNAARELYIARDRLGNSDDQFVIAECEDCGIWRTLPEMNESDLSRFYPNEYWGQVDPQIEWIKRSQREKTKFVDACALQGGTILDVGCGSGFFLRALNAANWTCFGVETGAAATASATRALGSDRVFHGTLLEARYAEERFDVVTLWSALEHTNYPRANLLEARRVIKTGGTVIVQVPNAASYQARWFGGDWFALDAPRHRYHFDQSSLGRLLSDSGFEVYRTTLFSRAHNAHALRQSLKAKLSGNGAGPLRRSLFLASIPLLKPFDLVMTGLGRGATLTVAARAI
jgi:2-polyprenyl-3-methyl-5-hydroxy-6-metoxy-1,4-benzoquinol methylase